MIPKVNSGDKLKIRAQDWNAIANHINSTHLDTDRAQRQRGIYAVNYSNADILAGQCLKFKGLWYSSTELDDAFADVQAGFEVSIPKDEETDGFLCFAAEDILQGDLGRIALNGACYALFSSYDATLPYAVPDGAGRLKSSALGTIQVVWVDSRTKQGLVILGSTSAQGGYFDLRVDKDENDQWQCTVFNSGEPEYSGSPTGHEISGRVIIGNHTEYMPITAIPISGQGVIYLCIEHDGTDSGYAGFTYEYVFAASVPEVGFNERKYIAPLGYVRYRNGTDATNGYRVTRTSHSRGGALEIAGRWV